MGKSAILRKEIRQLRRDLRKSDLRSQNQQFKAQRREVKVARSSLDLELSKLNNLRQEVIADRGQFVSREAYDADQRRITELIRSEIKATNTQVAVNTETQNMGTGGRAAAAQFRATLNSNLTMILLVVAIVAGLVGHFLT